MQSLIGQIEAARTAEKILGSTEKNLKSFLAANPDTHDMASIQELVATGQWQELDNRFFRSLDFGTGGLRGKSIGAVVTTAERGASMVGECPAFPCTGTNAMNFYSVSRATQGLVNYVLRCFADHGRRPAVCIAHDTRFFSREFAELAAKIVSDFGCDAYLFESFRSTPELSFAVRQTRAQAGINITASHNPSEYNGYKVYFDDGCQVVEPHASEIIKCVNAVPGEKYAPVADKGSIHILGSEMDSIYMERLASLPLEPAMLAAQSDTSSDFKVVYTPLHGTGAVIIKPMFERLGIATEIVAEQNVPDGRFPTVKSPNPENGEALAMGMALADKVGADVVIATDPDDDRMGIAARDAAGKMVLLTGNQTGSILCWHRITRHLATGIVHPVNLAHATVIKTFVTTDLQKAIAERNGIACVETLTGFKYIGEKLGKYEAAIPAHLRTNYRDLDAIQARDLLLEYSKYYLFGGEESYGYSAGDFVRDKDGNAAAVMLAEAAAYARSQGLTLVSLLDQIYCEYGYYAERGESIVMEGASGAANIQKLVDSYATNPPIAIDGSPVTKITDFARGGLYDSEGDELPCEAMLIISLADGRRVAVRPSGTEPKIKYYLFAKRDPGFASSDLPRIKGEVAAALACIWHFLKADAAKRVEERI